MLTLIKKIFIWWNQDTIGTKIKTILFGKFVGKDHLGNKLIRKDKNNDDIVGGNARWIPAIIMGGNNTNGYKLKSDSKISGNEISRYPKIGNGDPDSGNDCGRGECDELIGVKPDRIRKREKNKIRNVESPLDDIWANAICNKTSDLKPEAPDPDFGCIFDSERGNVNINKA